MIAGCPTWKELHKILKKYIMLCEIQIKKNEIKSKKSKKSKKRI